MVRQGAGVALELVGGLAEAELFELLRFPHVEEEDLALLDQREDVVRRGGVEVAGGLVGQYQGRLQDQRTGDRHPLLHAP
mgnify:CR=1 FL=1